MIQLRNKQDDLKKIRQSGLVPGIIYGRDVKDSILISADFKQLVKIIDSFNRHNHIIEFKHDDKTLRLVIKDFTQCKITSKVIHVDFFAIPKDASFISKVPIKYINTMQHQVIKDKGVMQISKFFIDLKITGDIPECIVVDVGNLSGRLRITSDDLQLADNTSFTTKSKNLVLASIIGVCVK